jgi:hypothetical protein
VQLEEIHSKSFIVGRNEQTKIKSTRCAKQQGSNFFRTRRFLTNFYFIVSIHIENGQVYIEQLGTNASFINEIPINTNDKQILKDGDILHLLENEYGYTVRISNNQSVKPALKRQNTDDDQILPKKQKMVMNEIEPEEEEEDASEENRLTWIQQQLDALQSNANQSYVFQSFQSFIYLS